MEPQAGRLICTAPFSDHLTVGKPYRLLAYRAERDHVRVQNDRGRTRWYPATCFGRTLATSPTLLSFTLDDPIADPHHDCIEVTVRLANGERRWRIVATLSWLAAALAGKIEPKEVLIGGLPLTQFTYLGDRLTAADGARFGTLAVPHLIVVTVLSEAIVEEALRDLAGQGHLLDSTRPLGADTATGETDNGAERP